MNPGTAGKPFATLERARNAVREERKGGHDSMPTTIWLHAGDYQLEKTWELTAEDSGSERAPVVYRGADDKPARLLGSRLVRACDFQPVSAPATLARIHKNARGRILELDLLSAGIAHRNPYPDVFTDSGNLIEVFYKGRRMPLARFPNEGYMTMKKVLDNAGGLRDRNWASSTWTAPPGNGSGGTFEYREEFYDEHADWQKVLDHGVWLKGYWRVPWQNEAARVQSIDTGKHTVTFAKAVPGGIGSKYQRPEGSGKEQYWLMNLLEAVDSPGEWCVDFKDQKLYFYPPALLKDGQVQIADNSGPIIRLDGASHIILRQLTVEQGLGHGMEIKGGRGNQVAGCVVRNVSRYGVVLDGGCGNEVLSSDLYWLGAGGVWLGGGDETSAPHVPAGHRVINNHIHHFAQIERVYAPGVNCGYTGGGGGGHHPAVGMLVAHNLIHDTPHAGVLHGSWDSVFEFNDISGFCQVSNDMGGFYCYELFERGGNQTFRYNYLHDSAEGDGIYFDNDHRDMHLYGNIVALDSKGKRGTGFLYKIGSQAKGNPQSIDCTNNIAIHCKWGFEFVSALSSRIANNVAVNCEKPFAWTLIHGKDSVRGNDSFGSGKNVSYDSDPGFVNMGKNDFRLKRDSKIFSDLPGFKPIPVDQIGLYVDEYRKRLPNDEEAGRTPKSRTGDALGVEIEDRR